MALAKPGGERHWSGARERQGWGGEPCSAKGLGPLVAFRCVELCRHLLRPAPSRSADEVTHTVHEFIASRTDVWLQGIDLTMIAREAPSGVISVSVQKLPLSP